MKFGLKFPTFRAAPGSIDAIQEEAKHMCRNDQPTHYDASKDTHLVLNDCGLNNDQPPRKSADDLFGKNA